MTPLLLSRPLIAIARASKRPAGSKRDAVLSAARLGLRLDSVFGSSTRFESFGASLIKRSRSFLRLDAKATYYAGLVSGVAWAGALPRGPGGDMAALDAFLQDSKQHAYEVKRRANCLAQRAALVVTKRAARGVLAEVPLRRGLACAAVLALAGCHHFHMIQARTLQGWYEDRLVAMDIDARRTRYPNGAVKVALDAHESSVVPRSAMALRHNRLTLCGRRVVD